MAVKRLYLKIFNKSLLFVFSFIIFAIINIKIREYEKGNKFNSGCGVDFDLYIL